MSIRYTPSPYLQEHRVGVGVGVGVGVRGRDVAQKRVGGGVGVRVRMWRSLSVPTGGDGLI